MITLAEKRQTIRDALAGGPLTAVELAQRTGIASNEVRRVLREGPFVAVDTIHVKQGNAKRWSDDVSDTAGLLPGECDADGDSVGSVQKCRRG